MAVHAYVMPNGLTLNEGTSTTFSLGYSCIVGDGISSPAQFGSTFQYDATQTPAINLANLKQDAANKSATYGFTVPTSNIVVFMAVN